MGQTLTSFLLSKGGGTVRHAKKSIILVVFWSMTWRRLNLLMEGLKMWNSIQPSHTFKTAFKKTPTNRTTVDFRCCLLTCLPYFSSHTPHYIPSMNVCVCLCARGIQYYDCIIHYLWGFHVYIKILYLVDLVIFKKLGWLTSFTKFSVQHFCWTLTFT